METPLYRVLQAELRGLFELERISNLPLQERIIDAALRGSVEPGPLVVNVDAKKNEFLVVENIDDPTVANHVMLDSFSIIRQALGRGELEENGEISPRVRLKLKRARERRVAYHCARLRAAAMAAWKAKYDSALDQRDWECLPALLTLRLRLIEIHGTVILLRLTINGKRREIADWSLRRIRQSTALLQSNLEGFPR
jgi:hypothetical protein